MVENLSSSLKLLSYCLMKWNASMFCQALLHPLAMVGGAGLTRKVGLFWMIVIVDLVQPMKSHVIFSLVLLESLHYWLQRVVVVMLVWSAREGAVGLANQEQLYHETLLNPHLQVFQCISASWGIPLPCLLASLACLVGNDCNMLEGTNPQLPCLFLTSHQLRVSFNTWTYSPRMIDNSFSLAAVKLIVTLATFCPPSCEPNCTALVETLCVFSCVVCYNVVCYTHYCTQTHTWTHTHMHARTHTHAHTHINSHIICTDRCTDRHM